jgi:hypothetical protein
MAATIEVLEDEAIPGIAQLVESRPDDDPQALVTELLDRALTVDVGIPSSRSTNRYLSIIDRIRGRQLVEDLGKRQFDVDWFAFHVPPGAKGRLKLTHKKEGTLGVKLKVLGLGFGGGRSLSLALQDDYGERTKCLLLQRTFEANFRVFEDISGRQYFQVDVERVVKDKQYGAGECQRCSIGALPEFDFTPVAEVAIDVTHDPNGRTISDSYSIDENKELELSLPLNFTGFDILPGIALRRNVKLECEYGYTLPGGYCYTPFRDDDGWRDFPFWLRT